MDYLVHVAKVALPLYPQFGLEPNVYYIPPIHVPAPYLVQMFGPGVEQAIETYKRARDDARLLGALMLFGSTPEIIHRFRVTGDHALGYDEKGGEVVRVPLTEPVQVRAFFDEARKVYRHNIT
jgi:nitrate reductase beta subunit